MPSPFRVRVAGLAALISMFALGSAPSFGQGEAETLSASFRKAARRVLPAVVTVRSVGVASPFETLPGPRPFGRGGPGEFGPDLPRREPGGSGVIIDADKGYVLTNDHVVQGALRVVVTLHDGRERTAEQVRRDPKSDLALLVIDPKGLSQAEWGDSEALETGDWVLAIGQPFGLSDTVTAGIVSGKGRGIGMAMYEDLIQTDAAINPGNSGGPLVNLNGEIVGINTAIKTLNGGYEGVGFAVPATRARRVAADLAEHGRVRRAYIGIMIGRVDRATAERLDLPGAVAVNAVTAGSPAAEAGLRPGDVITGLQGKPVRGQGSLQSAIEVAPVGEPLTLTIDRDGERRDVEVRPEAQPEAFGLGEPRPGRPRVLPSLLDRPGLDDRLPPEDLPPGDDRDPADDPGPSTPPRREQAESRAPGRFPALGLRLGEPTPSLARRFHLGDSPSGLVVLGVEPGSPADRGGLEIGLLITDVANRKVETLADFRAALAGRPEGRDLLIRIIKDSKAEFRVILEPGESRTPDKPAIPEAPDPVEEEIPSPDVSGATRGTADRPIRRDATRCDERRRGARFDAGQAPVQGTDQFLRGEWIRGRGLMTRRILVVDDTPLIREHLRVILETDGYEVETAGDGRSALASLQDRPFHLVITDLRMPDVSGMELLQSVRAEKLPLGVIVLTGHGDTQVALEAMKAGADDFVTKPYEPDHLRFLVRRILERRRLIDELEGLRKQMRADYSFHNMVSKSPKMRKVFDLIEQVGPLGSTVLIHGETGTGKELVAQAIHAADTRRQGEFVALNCAALHESLLESELFGHERGLVHRRRPAQEGAVRDRRRRHALPRRGGRRLAGHAVQAPPRPPVGDLRAGRRDRDAEGRRPDRRRQQQAARGRGEGRPVPHRPLLPAERDPDRPAPAARAARGHPAAGDALPGEAAADEHAAGHRDRLRGDAGPAGPLMAGPRPRAGERDQGGRRDGRRHDHPSRCAPRDGRPPRRPCSGAAGSLIDIDRPLPELTDDLIGQVERDYFVRLLARYKGNVARCAKHSGLSRRSVTQKLQKYDLDRSRFKDASHLDSVEA